MLISKFGNVDIDMVEEFEEKMMFKIPEHYRDFLIKYNGGETPNTSFVTDDESSDIKGFYGLGNVKYSLDNRTLQIVEGENYLPIALDSFGNELLISVNKGSVFFLNHENGSITKLATDFSEFLSKCNSEPIKATAIKSVEERERELIAKGRGSIITDALRDLWRQEIKKYREMKLEEVVL